eukprot:5830986-Lingulodinium_polyedra.AAC.1
MASTCTVAATLPWPIGNAVRVIGAWKVLAVDEAGFMQFIAAFGAPSPLTQSASAPAVAMAL